MTKLIVVFFKLLQNYEVLRCSRHLVEIVVRLSLNMLELLFFLCVSVTEWLWVERIAIEIKFLARKTSYRLGRCLTEKWFSIRHPKWTEGEDQQMIVYYINHSMS